jgi:hypothetical protein
MGGPRCYDRLVSTYQTARRHIPEHHNLNTHPWPSQSSYFLSLDYRLHTVRHTRFHTGHYVTTLAVYGGCTICTRNIAVPASALAYIQIALHYKPTQQISKTTNFSDISSATSLVEGSGHTVNLSVVICDVQQHH